MNKTDEFIWLADNEVGMRLCNLDNDGIKLWLKGGKLKFQGAQGKITEDILNWLRQNKEAIVTYISEKDSAQEKGFDLTSIQKAYVLR